MFWSLSAAHACANEMVAADQSRWMAVLAFSGLATTAALLTSGVVAAVLYRRIRPSLHP